LERINREYVGTPVFPTLDEKDPKKLTAAGPLLSHPQHSLTKQRGFM
jgi:hypothetical protein